MHNFSAGPAALPRAVLERAKTELLDWQGRGCSVMEVSHRSAAFVELAERTEQKLRELLGVSDEFSVLFLQGGATLQFSMVPMNLANGANADYLITGVWSRKALAAAGKIGPARSVTRSETEGSMSTTLDPRHWELDPGAAYLHITPNETIDGVEWFDEPPLVAVPVVADMSSNILSRPINVDRYGLIYAGAQKNLGPSGITVVIIKNSLLQRSGDQLPDSMSYAVQSAKQSMLNTPPTFAWYLVELVLDWIAQQGGVGAMADRNRRKAQLLYGAIDGSGLYASAVPADYRSRMNAVFSLRDESLNTAFLSQAEQAGLIGLKGHRSVGGFRASLYNAVEYSSVEALVAFMQEFERSQA